MKKDIVVGVSSFAPLVSGSGSSFKGFEVDLWEMIAKKLNLSFSYKKYNFTNLLEAVKDKEVDIAFAGITRTKEREEKFSFSYFTLRTGLAILINEDNKISFLKSFKDMILKNLKKILNIILFFFVLIVIVSNIIWFLERDLDSLNIRSSYGQGIIDSLWWTTGVMSGAGGTYPESGLGKFLGFFSIFVGLVIFSIIVAQVASFITLSKMKHSISDPKDLAGKKVGTKRGTTSEKELEKLGAKIVLEDNIEDVFDKLANKEIDAVVFDEPVIRNFVKHNDESNLIIASETFNKQTYGFAFPEGSALREEFNRELLGLFESGEYDALLAKWFGV